ncbi:MAG: ABC transporter substrate-binding protein [Defluviicoccus sp.]
MTPDSVTAGVIFTAFKPAMKRVLCLFLLVIACHAAAPAARAETGPVAVINALHAILLQVMQNADQLGVQGRYDTLEPRLRETYDFERMIAIAAGSHWANAGEAERAQLLTAFIRYSVATYASRFVGYDGEQFAVQGERAGPRETILIDTTIQPRDAQPIPITYVMRKRDTGDARVVDVLLEKAISELAVRRSDFAKILQDGGPPRLTQVLNERSDELLRGAP